ncbi:MarR family winged helix-turn-helix transcriptional regulator [Chryseobacterium koreense]|uniref:MarR family winged helix-turn-helix transcriptional regulator n=1 Tax=Chryseobacterium koreense TaxID=232216 RepID=UPI00160A5A8C|nr:MarR family transcriptional regulator [Chryseobacterium koreense]MBB5334135.1 DNA-binding MarR family transcriptional regulator [Chryseobacterium koreense]
MNYRLIEDVIELVRQFEIENKDTNNYEVSIEGFKNWILRNSGTVSHEPDWEGKENGRSAESVISTLLVHLNRYAKSYSKSAILGSDFSTQDDFIYLINLKAFGEMSKMDLIKKNVHEKPVGMQIINRLIHLGWIEQRESTTDKRSKVISITQKGLTALENQMNKIRTATTVVTGNLSENEKMELIRLLHKLDDFHQQIYEKNKKTEQLLDEALNTIMQ